MRTTNLVLAAASVLSSFVVGCGGADPAADETLARQASAVQGGKIDTSSKHNYAVGIANRYGGVCSGTLIAPNLVLTARHCVVRQVGAPQVDCTKKFGANVEAEAVFVTTEPNLFRAGSYYAASEIITPKATNFCGNDIALVILKDSIDAKEAAPATPVVQFKMTDARIGKNVTAVGYGITSPSAEDSGQRRTRENIPLLCIPGSDSIDCDGELARFSDNPAEFVTAGFVCSGDSGGGAFDQKSFTSGTPYVLGALSRGPQTEERCLAAIYSRTDMHAELIISAAIKAADQGGYEAPAWIKPEGIDGPTVTDPGAPCEGETCTEVIATEPSPAPAATTTTTTSGCSVVHGTSSSGATGTALGMALAGLVVAATRRRRSAR